MAKKRMALAGVGGFGGSHVRVISKLVEQGELECVACVDPNLESCKDNVDILRGLGAAYFTNYQEMLDAHPDLDFVALATPIALHKPMAIEAMRRGMHVLTEKPAAVLLEDAVEMAAVSQETGKRLAVQYQNTSGEAFNKALELIRNGEIGELQRVTGLGMWKRTDQYYERTGWAGKLKHGGSYVLDGTLHNPFSHLFYNTLTAAGRGDALGAVPVSVQAELYHAHTIESEDMACLRARMANGVEMLLYTTLCAGDNRPEPYIRMEGSKGTIMWHYNDILHWTGANGEEQTVDYSADFQPNELMSRLYRNLMAAMDDPSQRLYASIDGSIHYLTVTNGAFQSSGAVHTVPDSAIDRFPEGGSMATYIRDIEATMEACAQAGQLFSEYGVSWAVPGTQVGAEELADVSKHWWRTDK
ncbi:Gfo/Idh/MocA family protein [Paenibacillus daejeonensis]|uniref:Gfo/Idh/MocA family protein n=1 Tax=Paenibacillus daejeonensis TaxID=135193 RepID=UPI00036349CE|nr:Gfo/Idh/MocA family oxidoreductase [Paenibacillus daejeonensis]